MIMLFSLYKSQSKTLIFNFQTFNSYLLRRSYRSKRKIISATDSSEFRISFLENQCGLSGKSLIRASNLLKFEPSDERPISVLKLLLTFGFPQSNITKIISAYPCILQFDSQKILNPKLEFLVSIAQSETDLVQIVTKRPGILGSSLENQLIPAFEFLKSVAGSYQNAATVVKCKPDLLTHSIINCYLPNMEFLITVGVPKSQIVKVTTCYGTVIGKTHDKFCKIVMKIKEMGFDPSSAYFLNAVQALCFLTDSSWKSRCDVLRSFGLSKTEIIYMFKKVPCVFTLTEKRIKEKMEFFVKKLGWSPSRLSANPYVLNYSLEKRTIPRCSVLQVLVSKDCISGNFMISTKLAISEKKFLKDFVTAYKDQVPEIMDAYQGKLKFDIYTFIEESKV